MCFSVAVHWTMPAILIVMLYVLKLSPEAAWPGVVLSFLSFPYVFYRRYRGGKWRTICIVHSQAELLATDHDHDFHEPRDL
jgi:MATE family multidrug resistance protein